MTMLALHQQHFKMYQRKKILICYSVLAKAVQV